MRAGVVGCGYVGLVVAASLADVGHDVVAAEVDPDRLAALRDGRVPFVEPGLEALLRAGLTSGRLTLVGAAEDLVDREIVLVAVPTPDDPADPGHGALSEVAEPLAGGRSVVVIKSTVTPEVVERLGGIFGARLVVNPEFLREGRAVEDFRHPARLVVGGAPEAVERLLALYEPLYAGVPIVRTDPRTAALAKLAANAMLAVRVSFANELARLAAGIGADLGAVLEVVGSDPRIGRSHLAPSLGYGGACLPKDTRLLAGVGRASGAPLRVVEAADQANREQGERVVEDLGAALGGLAGRRIAVWGIAFKPGTDDLRASAPLAVVRSLIAAGAEVVVHDPVAVAPGLAQVADPRAAVDQADALIVASDGYGAVDPAELRARNKLVFDVAGALDERWHALGWRIRA